MIQESGKEAIQAWLAIIEKNTSDRRQIAFKYKSKKALLNAAGAQGYFGIQIPAVQLAPRVILWGSPIQQKQIPVSETSDLLASLSQALSAPQVYEEQTYEQLVEVDDELQHLIDITMPQQMTNLNEKPQVSEDKGFFYLDFTI